MNLLRRLWTEEPVIVRTVLALAVSGGVLTATQASAWGDAVSAVLVALSAVTARAKVTPTGRDAAKDSGAADVGTLLLVAVFIVVLILLFHGRIR